MFAFSGLDKETQQPVVETHAEKKQMRIMQGCRRDGRYQEVLIEGAEERRASSSRRAQSGVCESYRGDDRRMHRADREDRPEGPGTHHGNEIAHTQSEGRAPGCAVATARAKRGSKLVVRKSGKSLMPASR